MRSARAFTLIELIVVVAIIGFTAIGFGLALKDTGGNSLATGQTLLSTMVSAARAQAAVHQTEARLLIYGTRPPAGDPEKFLRLMQVVRAESPGSPRTNWLPASGVVSLPRGIYVVPTATNGLLAAGVIWPSNPPLTSTLAAALPHGQPTGTPFATPATAFYIEFLPDGTCSQVPSVSPTQPSYARLLVGTASLSAANLPQFNNSGAVRGLVIRPSGSVTFINDATSF